VSLFLSTISSVSFASDTSNQTIKTENTELANIEKNMLQDLKSKVMSGVITPQEAHMVINELHEIKEKHQRLLVAAIKGYSAPTVRTSYPILPWEVVGVSGDGYLFERIERLSTPSGWIVKTLNIHIRSQANDTVAYMNVPDPEHKWKL
jgi:hypothetical protein